MISSNKLWHDKRALVEYEIAFHEKEYTICRALMQAYPHLQDDFERIQLAALADMFKVKGGECETDGPDNTE